MSDKKIIKVQISLIKMYECVASVQLYEVRDSFLGFHSGFVSPHGATALDLQCKNNNVYGI